MDEMMMRNLKRFNDLLHRSAKTVNVVDLLKRIYGTFLDQKTSALRLVVDAGLRSYTDGKTITVSLIPYALDDKYSNEDWLILLKALLAHESQHVNSSNFEDIVLVRDWYGAMLNREVGVSESVGANIGQKMLNIIEDGRIEAIAVQRRPGMFLPFMYLNQIIRANAEIEEPADTPMNEFADFMNNVLSFAKTGLYSPGIEVYANTQLEEYFLKIEFLINEGVKARTSNECRVAVQKILETITPYLKELIQDEELQNQMQQTSSDEYTSNNENQYNEGGSSSLRSDSPTDDDQDDDGKEGGKSQKEKNGKKSKNNAAEDEEKENRSKKRGSNKEKNDDGQGKDGEQEDAETDAQEKDENQSEPQSGKGKKQQNQNDDDAEGDDEGEGQNGSNKSKKSQNDDAAESEDDGDADGGDEGEPKTGKGKNQQSQNNEDAESEDEGEGQDGSSKDKKGQNDGDAESEDGDGSPQSTALNQPDSSSESQSQDGSEQGESEQKEQSDSGVNRGKGFSTAKQPGPLSDERLDEIRDLMSKQLKSQPTPQKQSASSSVLDQKGLNKVLSAYKNTRRHLVEMEAGLSALIELPKSLKMQAAQLQREIKKIVDDKRQASRNLRRGSLNTGALWKTGLGDDTIFERRNKVDKSSIAFYILMDDSGSMSGGGDGFMSKCEAARSAAAVIEEAVKGILPCKIALFNNDGLNAIHTVIKDFDDKRKGNFSWTSLRSICPDGYNSDSVNIRVAAEELSRRREVRKVLFLLSDGLPSAYGSETDARREVRQAVKDTRSAGIIVVPIMFGDEEFRKEYLDRYKEMYEKNIISCSPQEITATLAKTFRLILTR